MTQVIEVPGHGQVEFPDGMSDDDIAAAIKKNLMVPKPSVGKRILQGMKDPIDAGAQLLTHILPQSVVNAGNKANNWLADKTGLVGKLPEGGVDQSIKENEQQFQQNGIDWARLGGNILSPMNLAVASRIPQAASLGGRLTAGAGAGALNGLIGTPVTGGDFASEKAKQVGLGAVTGGALSGVASALGRVVSPNTRPQVRALLNEGVTPTPGQILGGVAQRTEDKLTSVPILGDAITSARRKGLDEFNEAALNRAVAPIGGQANGIGREGVASVRTQLNDAYNNLLPHVTFKADQQFSADIQNLQSLAAALPTEQSRRFEKVLRETVIKKFGPRGTMDGEALKGLESELGELASGLRRDALFDNRQLGNAIGEIQTAIRSNLQRTNPSQAGELKAINEGYANYARLRDAASRQGSADGVFTPGQLSAGVRAQDRTKGKRAFSEGTALMQDLSDAGKNVLSSKYPDSGTAGRWILGTGTVGALTGGAAANPPIGGGAMAVGALSILPYLPGGRQAMAALLARRPDGAERVADVLRQAGPYLAPSGQALLGH